MSGVLANVTAVAVRGRGLLIAGPPASGKSSLALALIDRGAVLVGDDAVSLEAAGGHCLVGPPPYTSGLIEVANVGLVAMPTAVVPAALVLRLDAAAPRYPLALETRSLAGCAVPCLPFSPGDAAQALRAEYALESFGLVFPDDPADATQAVR